MQDSRGKQQLQEAGAYEARMFCEMLLKGSVNMFEVSPSIVVIHRAIIVFSLMLADICRSSNVQQQGLVRVNLQ